MLHTVNTFFKGSFYVTKLQKMNLWKSSIDWFLSFWASYNKAATITV